MALFGLEGVCGRFFRRGRRAEVDDDQGGRNEGHEAADAQNETQTEDQHVDGTQGCVSEKKTGTQFSMLVPFDSSGSEVAPSSNDRLSRSKWNSNDGFGVWQEG